MAPPDLNSPEALAAYRGELRRFARGWRYLGLGLVTLGAAGLVWVSRDDAPWLSGWRGPATIGALAVGWAILIAVIVARTRYHLRRMAG